MERPCRAAAALLCRNGRAAGGSNEPLVCFAFHYMPTQCIPPLATVGCSLIGAIWWLGFAITATGQ